MLGIFDSGLGGVVSLQYFREAFPDMDICYLGDTLYVPYGEKDLHRIHDRTFACLEWMFSQGCSLVILACNTASAAAIRERQSLYPDKKVLSVTRPGVEEILAGNYHTIGLLATQTTVQTKIYDSVLHRFNPEYELKIEAIAANGIVDFLESDTLDTKILEAKVFDYCNQFSDQIQCIVLGCTHYPLIVPYINKRMQSKNKQIPLINPSLDAAKSLQNYFNNHPEIRQKMSYNSITNYHVTGDSLLCQEKVKSLLGLEIEAIQISM